MDESSNDSDLNEDSEAELPASQDRRKDKNIESIDLYGPNGKGLLPAGADGDIDNDSDLENLQILEKFHLDKKKKREERR